MALQIQIKRDEAARWAESNPILAEGEWGVEVESINTPTPKIKIGDGITEWNDLAYLPFGNSGDSSTTEDITSTLTVGGVSIGDLVPTGTTLTDFIKLLIAPTILPTINQSASVNASGISTQTIEIGTTFVGTLNYSFSRGSIDNKDGSADTLLVGAEISNTFSGAGIDTSGNINTPILSGNNQWQVEVNYAIGTDDYFDSNGDAASNLDAQRVAGSVSDSSNVITGQYKYWYNVGAENSTPNLSAAIRALTDDGFIGNISFDIVIPANTKEVAIYLPDTVTIQSILYVESLNVDVTGTFVSSAINVDDGGGNSIGYNKYTAVIGGTGYPSSATYNVTINI